MPRSVTGVYTVPAGINPVVAGTIIYDTWANPTLADVAQGVTDSLDRNGRGGMLAGLKLLDGTLASPGLTFSTETGLGLYRVGAGILAFVAGSAELARITATGLGVGVAAAYKLDVLSSSASVANFKSTAASAILRIADNTAERGYVGSGASLVGGASANDFGLIGAAGCNLVLGSGNAARITVNTDGNVVINTPGASTALRVNGLAGQVGQLVIGDFSSNWPLQLSSSAGTTGRVGILFDRTGGTAKQWVIGNDTDGGTDNSFDIRDVTRAATTLSISTTGNVTVAAPTTGVALAVTGVANTEAASFSTGVSVGNAANTSATVLDHYEEGTFTPTLSFAGAGVGITYAVQVGFFTRVGNRVHFSLRVALTSKGSSVGGARVAGLPYSVTSNGRSVSVALVSASGSGVPAAVIALVNSSLPTTVQLVSQGATGTSLFTDTSFTNATDFSCSGSYEVA